MSASPNRPHKARPHWHVTTDRDGAPDVRSHAHCLSYRASRSASVVSTETVSQVTQTQRECRGRHMACPSSVESDVRRRAHRSFTHDTHVMLEGRHQYRPATTLSPRAGPRCMAQLWQRKHQTRRIPGCEVLGVELNDGKPGYLLGADLTTMWRVGTRGDPLVLSGPAPLSADNQIRGGPINVIV